MDSFKLIQELNRHFDRKPANRSQLPLAAGFALGYAFNVPSSVVSSPKTYYMTHYEGQVYDFLSKVNERVVFDVAQAANLAYRVWLMRYNIVYIPHIANIGTVLASAGANQLRPKEAAILSGESQMDNQLVNICMSAVQTPGNGSKPASAPVDNMETCD